MAGAQWAETEDLLVHFVSKCTFKGDHPVMKKVVSHILLLAAVLFSLFGFRSAQAQPAQSVLPEQVYLVKDIYPGLTQSFPSDFQVFDGKVFFTANNPTYGQEAWFSDGTELGTKLLKDIHPGPKGADPVGGFTELNNKLYFVADDGSHGPEFWQTDGTEAGTQRIGGLPSLQDYFIFGNALGYIFFRAADASGLHLWRTDGTPEGTVKITTQPINVNYCPIGYHDNLEFKGMFYFTASVGDYECRLWRTSGVSGQAQQVVSIDSNLNYIRPQNLTAVGNKLYFTAEENNQFIGDELWVVDGVAGSCHLVKDINPGNNMSSNPGMLTAFKDKLYFSATGLTGNKLWRTDGTEAGTEMLPPAVGQPDYYWPYGIVYGNNLIFSARNDVIGPELFMSDGDQVFLVKDIVTDSCGFDCGSAPMNFMLINGQVLFTANSVSTYPPDRELWRTDGTAAGTLRVSDICPGSCSADPLYLYPLGTHVFFSADDGVHGGELWAYQPPLQAVYLPAIKR